MNPYGIPDNRRMIVPIEFEPKELRPGLSVMLTAKIQTPIVISDVDIRPNHLVVESIRIGPVEMIAVPLPVDLLREMPGHQITMLPGQEIRIALKFDLPDASKMHDDCLESIRRGWVKMVRECGCVPEAEQWSDESLLGLAGEPVKITAVAFGEEMPMQAMGGVGVPRWGQPR